MISRFSQLFPAFWRVFFVGMVFILPPFLASAEEAVDIGEIKVEDERQGENTVLDRTQTVTTIRPEDEGNTAQTVPSLIEQSAGVHLKRYGGLDDFSAISLRGSTAAQVQIYLDDIPLATSQGELTDLSILPLDTIDRIEVYRGGSPGLIPEATAGGVVILRTKDRPEKTETIIRNTAGSFFTYKGTASQSGNLGKISYVAAFERSQSEGDFKYINNNGTIYNSNDDYEATRQNNDFEANDLYTKLMFNAAGNTKLSFTNVFLNKNQGIPGLGNRESDTARLQTWRDLVSIVAKQKFDSVRGFSIHADAFFDFLNDQFNDPQGNIGLGVTENDDDTYRFGINIRPSYVLGSSQELRAFAAGRTEFYLPLNRLATPSHGPTSSRNQAIFGAEDEILLFSERLTLIPSIRLTCVFNDLSNQDPSTPVAFVIDNTRSDYQVSAKVGFKLRLVDQLYFKGNFFRGFRNPTFSELFGNRGTLVGNPTLSPEKAINFDAGLAYHYSDARPETRDPSPTLNFDIEATYFRNHFDDLIQFMQTSQYTIKAENLDKALIQGLEFSGRLKFDKRFGVYTSYTFQDAKNISNSTAVNGKYLPGRPKHELAAGVMWTEDWFRWFGTKLFSDLHYMSGNYLDTQNLLSVENRTLLAVGAATTFVKGITLSFSVKNLLNEQIEDTVGYPLPGRSYWAVAELKI